MKLDEVTVKLWDRTLGTIQRSEGDSVEFVYDEDYREMGNSISPFYLPLGEQRVFNFDELAGTEAFEGLPGVFADALPDAFGNSVIQACYQVHLNSDTPASPLEKLAYIGEDAIGALWFEPSLNDSLPDQSDEKLDVQELACAASSIVNNSSDIGVPEFYWIGAPAGGRRPKAIVNYDPDDETLRSGCRDPRSQEVPCIVKFDGVGSDSTADKLGEPQHYNPVEAAYTKMAKEAGLKVPEVRTLEVDGYCHLLSPRFDCQDGNRLHQVTFGGLKHLNYNDPWAGSYEEYLRTIRDLGIGQEGLREGFRRAVFNVLAVNQDDHVKNLSFQMDASGEWSLAPAYDLTYANGDGYTAAHQMTVAGKRSGITSGDLHSLGNDFDVENPVGIIEDVRNVIKEWPEYATEIEVPADVIERLRAQLDKRWSETVRNPDR